ncbi:uncharacterized protein [Chelonus insularis]|uniref:uncharacterized protein n=1 Tax=Chelonus insularis TaxID=460826 RepID=UPI00158B642B|nr:uncharacterized protein LOC118069532 [Chelonus insularis]
MALSMAIPLSGLELDQFNNLTNHLMMNRIDFRVMQPDARPLSPSTRSDSSNTSGISSLVLCSSNYTTPQSSSPVSSRSTSPTKDKDNSNNDTDSNVSANGTSNQQPRRPRSTPQRSRLAADLCDLNLFYRQLLQLPPTPLYRPAGKSYQHSITSQNSTTDEPPLKILYKNRDILNLEANLREPSWQMRTPSVPRHNIRYFMANRSIYFRLGDHGLKEDYPMRICKECDFKEPSPFLI